MEDRPATLTGEAMTGHAAYAGRRIALLTQHGKEGAIAIEEPDVFAATRHALQAAGHVPPL